MTVGNDLLPCTIDIATAEIDTSQFLSAFPFLNNRRLLLVDTPGLDDPDVEDSVNIAKIEKWLDTK